MIEKPATDRLDAGEGIEAGGERRSMPRRRRVAEPGK
jgi:hypothetical protein